jgi:DNA-binding response OmpR family regulator
MDKILVVDDDARGLHNVATFLRQEEYEVDMAWNGNQAALLLDKVKVDLVLSDIMMPGLDGFGLLKHIRSISPEIPVLLMSGFDVEVEEIIERAAVDFIIKPLDLDVLVFKIRRALDTNLLGKTRAIPQIP